MELHFSFCYVSAQNTACPLVGRCAAGWRKRTLIRKKGSSHLHLGPDGWFIDHIEMRDEAGRQRATFLFLSFTGCEEGRGEWRTGALWHASQRAGCTLHLSGGFMAASNCWRWWPVAALALWLRWMTLGMERERGLLLLFISPSIRSLRKPRGKAQTLGPGNDIP